MSRGYKKTYKNSNDAMLRLNKKFKNNIHFCLKLRQSHLDLCKLKCDNTHGNRLWKCTESFTQSHFVALSSDFYIKTGVARKKLSEGNVSRTIINLSANFVYIPYGVLKGGISGFTADLHPRSW